MTYKLLMKMSGTQRCLDGIQTRSTPLNSEAFQRRYSSTQRSSARRARDTRNAVSVDDRARKCAEYYNKNGKVFPYRALGPELIPVYRQSARM